MPSQASHNYQMSERVGQKFSKLVGGILGGLNSGASAMPTQMNEFYSPSFESPEDFMGRVAETPGVYDYKMAPPDSPFVLNNEASKKFYGNMLEEMRKQQAKAAQDEEAAARAHGYAKEMKDLDYMSDFFKKSGLPFQSGMSYSQIPIESSSNIYSAAQTELEKQAAQNRLAVIQANEEMPYVQGTVSQKFNTGETELQQKRLNLDKSQAEFNAKRPHLGTIAQNEALASGYLPFPGSALRLNDGTVINVDKTEMPVRDSKGELTGDTTVERKATFTPVGQGGTTASPQNPPDAPVIADESEVTTTGISPELVAKGYVFYRGKLYRINKK